MRACKLPSMSAGRILTRLSINQHAGSTRRYLTVIASASPSLNRIDSNLSCRGRLFSTTVRITTSSLVEKTKALLSNQISWSEKELSQADFLIASLLQYPRSHDSVQCTAQILNRWIDETRSGIDCTRLIGLPHRVLNAMKESETVSVEDALQLLNKMESIPDEAHRPDAKSFTMVLNMLSASPGNARTAELAEDLFQRALARGGQEDVMVWNSYLHVLSKCSIGDREASYRAEEVLKQMIRSKVVDHFSFAIVLHALANTGRPDRAQALLERMMNMDEVEATETMFNTCIDAFAKQGNGEQAEALLQTMLGRRSNLPPSTVAFASAINAWANSQHPEAAERAQKLLTRMEDLSCPPTTESYTAAIVAWSNSNKPWATKRARELLQTMETRCLHGEEQACPTIASYTSVIHALAKSRDRNSVKDAENLLQQMKEIARSGRRDFVLNKITYSAVINVLAKSRAPDAHKKALKLLREMQALAKTEGPHVAPNAVTFNSVITAFANQGEASEARMLLDEMIDEVSRGNEEVTPDTFTYAAVLHAYSKWRNSDSPRQSLELLEKMEAEYKNGNMKVKPNTVVYSSAIASLVHSQRQDAPEHAEALLKQMHEAFKRGNADVKPNSRVLGAVLQVWATSRSTEAPERATSLIKWAEAESKDGNRDVKPNRICYNYLLAAWAKSGREEAFTRVQKILVAMSNSEDDDVKPDVHSYLRLMTAMPTSSEDAPALQLRVLKFLFSAYAQGNQRLKPTPRTIHLVFMSCTSFRGTKASSKAACIALEEVGKIVLSADAWVLNALTFRLFFDASCHLAFGNRALIDELYQFCKRTRNWDEKVEQSYKRLRNIIPSS